ncbi:GIY-YIG nuclease family protein [Sphingomonas sp. DT-204]|uniref:GIY-YIG nuclease family protein n=1 Tax=Sphingomonas sp. DT-204 TaxID=3396166 RepID=UPI003F1B7C9D
MKGGYVYIMASRRNGTIYTGSTSNLVQRVWQHRNRVADGFTKEHRCVILVWFEAHDDLQEARLRERQIKKWNRPWKLRLIEEMNPRWDDLFETII